MLTDTHFSKRELARKVYLSLWARHKQQACGGTCFYCRKPLPSLGELKPMKQIKIKYSRRQLKIMLRQVVSEYGKLIQEHNQLKIQSNNLVQPATIKEMEALIKP